ncbi:MAG TPA: DUF4294 domain-containing protein [Bacteroidales bacterium]|nr:DUF4294 domain-containing protein [Bacteroidales bacterium]
MKIIKFIIVFQAILFFSLCEASAQMPQYIGRLINIDSIAQSAGMPSFLLQEVCVFPKDQYNRQKRYNKMARNFLVVYPIALQIKDEFVQIEEEMKAMNPRSQRKYMDKKDNELKQKYKKTLMKLTLSQSMMLVKLVDRETGNTSYELIKELRGSITAFFWQNIALLFKNNLKMHYDPEVSDKEIEMLVKRYEAGTL